MKSVKGICFATSLAVLLACEGDKALDPSLDGEGPVDARSPNTLEAPSLTATGISEARIDITWTDVFNESGYELYRSTDPDAAAYQLLATTDARVWSYSDTQANQPTLYCYKVRAVRTTGSKTTYSAFSSSACTITPPAAPSNVAATVSSYKVVVAWQDNSNIEAGFQIFRSQLDVAPFGLYTTTAANATSSLDGFVTAGYTYCYRLRAFRTVTGGGWISYAYSPESNTVCATIPPPSQTPTVTFQLYATPYTSSAVVVRTQLNSAETQPSSSGYRIRLERSLDGGNSWSQVSGYTTEDYYDTPLTPEVRVCYRVIASNEVGDGQPSNIACTAPPAAPSDLIMLPIDAGHVQLTWRDNSAVEDGYQVWMVYGYGNCSCGASACDAGWSEDAHIVAELPANTTSYVAPPLFGDVCRPSTSSYYIVATKDGGTSDWSNPVTWLP